MDPNTNPNSLVACGVMYNLSVGECSMAIEDTEEGKDFAANVV